MTQRWIIAGGGTGGHVMPGLALAEQIRERGDEVLFVGGDQGLETRLVPQAGFELVALHSRQVMGRGPVGRAQGALSLLAATLPARRAIARFAADRLISVGGYAALPATLAARTCGVPVILVEPNSFPGRVNRLCARFATDIFVGFAGAQTRFAAGSARIHHSGVPVRQALVDTFATAQARPVSQRDAPLRLLVFGGSQGARQINEAMMEALPLLSGLAIEVVHQTGDADRERVADAYAKSGISAEILAFEPDMAARYRWADLALCRAGALTIAELALSALPALLVPYPHAADDHQRHNALDVEAAGAGRCLAGRLDGERIATELRALDGDRARIARMSAAAAARARPFAAREIIEALAGATR